MPLTKLRMDFEKQLAKVKAAAERKEARLVKRLLLAKGKLTKQKLPPASKLRKKLDKVFAVWVKARGSSIGKNQCVTCLKWFPISELQAGHYVSRTHTSTRWDERNVFPQCVTDNVFKNGNLPRYTLFLQEKFGSDIIQELVSKSTVIKKMTKQDYLDLIQKYEIPT